MSNVTTKIVDERDLLNELALLIESISYSSASSNGVFHVGVSGGSLVGMLEKCLPGLNTDWDKWRIYFCDERVVPFDSPDSTYGLYRSALGGKVPLKEEQFIHITPGLQADEAAADYEKQLKESFGGEKLPEFDLLLLGVGPDGHTCSLFPGHELVNESQRWVAPITDSPKPPSARITLTFPVINSAKNCVFALSGAGKADILKKILVDKEDLPATRVNPTSGRVHWIIDKEAASKLTTQ